MPIQNEKLDPLAPGAGACDMSSVAGKPGPLAVAAGVLGAAIGWGLSKYSGSALFIPGGTTVLLLILFVKTPVRPKFFAGAISVTLGHVVWFLVGSAMTGQWSFAALDIVILSAGVIWLWASPGFLGALFLGIVQVASLIVNVIKLVSFAPGSLEHRSLTIHCLWRLLAIYCLVRGYLYMRKTLAAAAPAAEETTATNGWNGGTDMAVRVECSHCRHMNVIVARPQRDYSCERCEAGWTFARSEADSLNQYNSRTCSP